MRKALIEEWFPVKEISRDAAIEMAYKAVPAYIKHCRELKIPENKIKRIGRNFYDPKIRSLHPWFARRPCSAARALTLAAILPSKVNKEDFMKAISWEEKPICVLDRYPPILFYTNPKKELINELLTKYLNKTSDDIVVCDPMAGGGAIPLESLRLGFKSVAIDYNPVAYLILKGTIEYPSLFGDDLAQQVKEEIIKIISYSEKALGKFYPKDCEGYIIARGIKCQKCGGKIPLLHNSQITGKTYIALTFNPLEKDFGVTISKYSTELLYQTDKRGKIKCPYCNTIISKKQAYKEWTKNHLSILNKIKEGKIDINEILSTYILLVKQTKEGYAICDGNDVTLFLEACKTLATSFKELEKYLPVDEIPQNNEVFSTIKEYGIKHWYELFNPRQLLAIGMLLKYINDRSVELITKGELGAAIALYLALGISRVIDYNSILTSWKKGTIRDTLGSYAQSRKMSYSDWFCEAIVPYRNLNWIFEPEITDKKKTEGGIYPVLYELCKRTSGLGKKAVVIHGDSRFLSSVLQNVQVDVINVDPPYFDTHIYSDVSEYFWQILRIALKQFIDAGILFNESNIPHWSPTSACVPREGEVIVRKNAIKKKNDEKSRSFNKDWYANQMSLFLKECYSVIKDEGVLLIWFTHKSLDAWETVISALSVAGFYVTRIWPITSELLTRLVSKRNNSTLNTTLVIVARKRMDKGISEDELKKYANTMMDETYEALLDIDSSEIELKTFLLATAMCAITRVQPPVNEPDPIKYIQLKLIPLAKEIAKEYISNLQKQTKEKNSESSNLEKFF